MHFPLLEGDDRGELILLHSEVCSHANRRKKKTKYAYVRFTNKADRDFAMKELQGPDSLNLETGLSRLLNRIIIGIVINGKGARINLEARERKQPKDFMIADPLGDQRAPPDTSEASQADYSSYVAYYTAYHQYWNTYYNPVEGTE